MPWTLMDKIKRQIRLNKGLCNSCDEKALPGKVYCKKHLITTRQYAVAMRQKQESAGLCVTVGCLHDPVPGKKRCEDCLRKQREYAKKYRSKLADSSRSSQSSGRIVHEVEASSQKGSKQVRSNKGKRTGDGHPQTKHMDDPGVES